MTMAFVPTRDNCSDCIEATREDVEVEYISDHELSGPEDLTQGDHEEVNEITRHIIANEQGVFCALHIDES